MSLVDSIKSMFQRGPSRDEESAEQEEYGQSDPGVTELRRKVADPYGGDLNAVAHDLEDFKPRDPNP